MLIDGKHNQNEPQSDKPRVERGNICVSEKGQLFIAMSLTRLPNSTKDIWYGLTFSGEYIYADNFGYIAKNINDYLIKTYGNSYEEELKVE